MAFEIPTLASLVERARAAFDSNLPGADSNIWPNNIAVSAKVIAGRIWEIFFRLEFISQQAFVATSSGPYLARHAAQYGLIRGASTRAGGEVFVTLGVANTTIPAGTLLQRADGEQFITLNGVTIDNGGDATLEVEAVNVGTNGNTQGSESLSFLAAIAGAPASVSVSPVGLTGGAAIESDDALRGRVLARIQNPPGVGTETDYINWARAVAGVTRVFVGRRAFGPGTVGVYFMMDDTYADGIPQAADVAAVQAVLEAQAPFTASVQVVAPQVQPITIEIANLSPDTPSVRAAIEVELQDTIRRRASVSLPTEPAFVRASWITQAISNAAGEDYHTLQSPVADIAIQPGFVAQFDSSRVVYV